MNKVVKSYKSEEKLKTGETVNFITTTKHTTVYFETVDFSYERIVANHTKKNVPLKELHESVENLFMQYIIDITRNLELSRNR